MYPTPQSPPPWPPLPPAGGSDGSGRAPTRAQVVLTGVVATVGGIAGAVLSDASPTS